MTKAPLGGAGTGANPTDRGKKDTKRSIFTDGKGILLSVTVDGANRHDKKLVKRTLDAIIFERPSKDPVIQNMCMDKGYNFLCLRTHRAHHEISQIFHHRHVIEIKNSFRELIFSE